MNAWYRITNADRIASPTLLVYPDRIAENLQRMIRLVGDASKLRPHVKTHKLPQIIEMKLAAGINKFKVSTIAEAEMTAAAGGRDILLAYPLVGPNIHRFLALAQKFPDTDFSTLVDNPGTLSDITNLAREHNARIPLYVDLNVGMDRTGIIPGINAFELYRTIADNEHCEARGLHAYDGHLHESDFDVLREKTTSTFQSVWKLRDNLIAAGYVAPKVIASGTPTSRLLAKHSDVEVGLGTTVLWDWGQTYLSPDLDFLNAAVILARVVSHPTTNRICIDLGHKAVASEMPAPRVRFYGLEDATPVMHSEEHLVLETDRASDYPVGTVLYGIPRHICPTVALHSEVWCVRDGIATEAWPVVARARRITI